jgi:2-haloacid dehalogenase
MPAPSEIVFERPRRLSDLQPMTQRFTDVGLPAQLAQTWFAQVLRGGFALAAAGGSATFSAIADGVLRSLFPQHAPDRDPGEAVQHVLDGSSRFTPGVSTVLFVPARRPRGSTGPVELGTRRTSRRRT